MSGNASAEGQVDIIGHILDSKFLEVPFGHILLPQFAPIFGIDFSITRHVVMLWVATVISFWSGIRYVLDYYRTLPEP